MGTLKFEPDRVHPAYRTPSSPKASFPIGLFVACLVIVFGGLAVVANAPLQAPIGLSANDPRSIIAYRIIPPIRAVAHTISVGNSKTFAYFSGLERRFSMRAQRLTHALTARLHVHVGHHTKRVVAQRHKVLKRTRVVAHSTASARTHVPIAPLVQQPLVQKRKVAATQIHTAAPAAPVALRRAAMPRAPIDTRAALQLIGNSLLPQTHGTAPARVSVSVYKDLANPPAAVSRIAFHPAFQIGAHAVSMRLSSGDARDAPTVLNSSLLPQTHGTAIVAVAPVGADKLLGRSPVNESITFTPVKPRERAMKAAVTAASKAAVDGPTALAREPDLTEILGVRSTPVGVASAVTRPTHALGSTGVVRTQSTPETRKAQAIEQSATSGTTSTARRSRVVAAAAPPVPAALPSPKGERAELPAHQAVGIPHMPFGPMRPNTRHSGSYLNYDVFASPQSAYGIFGYGTRVGSGIAQVDVLARAFGENRGIMLAGLAWQRHNDTTGSTLTIGDSESYRGKYEESVRFDGISYTSRNLSYALGWERTDFGESAMRFGSAVAQVSATKRIAPRLTGEAHFFADASTQLIGLGATWATPTMGEVRLGLAPARGHGLTGFFGYAFTSPRLRVSIDDRIWGAQSFDIGELAPANYRQLRATVEYKTSPTDAVRVAYATQAQGGFSTRATTLGYSKRVGGTDLHVDFASTASGSLHNTGVATYLSVPLGGGRSVTEQNSLQGGTASNSITYKQDLPESGVGTAYALNYGRNGTSITSASVTSQTLGSTTKVDVSHVGNTFAWDAEFSGSVFFFDGRPYAVNQTLDQSQALDALNGRGSANLMIVSETGRPLPAGSIVRVLGESGEWRVDADGSVEIDDLATGPQTLIVTLPHGTCILGIIMPPNLQSSSYDFGKQLCLRY